MKEIPVSHLIIFLLLEELMLQLRMMIFLIISMTVRRLVSSRKRKKMSPTYRMLPKIPSQIRFLHRMVSVTDKDCMVNLRMDRNAFGRLCLLLKEVGGLCDRKYVSVEEQVAMFILVLAHHKKNQVVRFNFQRSGHTVSIYVHAVLRAVIKLHALLLTKPQPIVEGCEDPRFKWFKGCIGALDGTYIDVRVLNEDKPRYRNRKGHITTNTLAACDPKMRFIYVLPGWEGSAADGRVLRDAINRPFGLKVPRGTYYLCDNAYANCDGFLTPFKGSRYHLKEWGPESNRPKDPEELFNLRHTKARNVIERAFGVLKMRWGILRSASFYPIKTQTRLIMACFLLHNFIRNEMADDPLDGMIEDDVVLEEFEGPETESNVDTVEPTTSWNQMRRELAEHMWNAAAGHLG